MTANGAPRPAEGPAHAPRAANRPRVVVKFHDGVGIPYEDGLGDNLRRLGIGAWDRLVAQFPGITLNRLLQDLPPERIQALVDRALDLDPTYRPPNMLTYFVAECPVDVTATALADTLAAWDTVQFAYVESPPPSPPQPITPADEPHFPNQGYLRKAPEGIDAEHTWGLPGGGGQGIHLVDVEQGWMLTHEDLAPPAIPLLWGQNHATFDHGTSSLGIAVARDNAKGGIGVAPLATASAVSEFDPNGAADRPNALLAAIAALSFGDVLLLEMQSASKEPVETDPALFDLIRLSTALGITVVEPAGNAGKPLDAYKNPFTGALVLNRASKDFRDSGAILVGSCTSTVPHTPLKAANTGTRVDCYAWGENVDTCSTDSSGTIADYTTEFGGTSSASAIIAGAALVVQGLAEATIKRRLSAGQMRAVLSDPTTGTAAENSPEVMVGDPGVGIMPDLTAILKALKITPDLYLRDVVGDVGDPHNGAINASPDIILRSVKVADGQQAFGQSSGTEDTVDLSDDASDQHDNWIYVRMRNRGSAPAINATATVYWSPVATLVAPYLWTPVGSVPIPSVPAGDVLTVADPIPWPKTAVPQPGHYCFVGLVGNADDPAPGRPDFLTWTTFHRLIRENNNVTWRNFVVAAPPSSSSGTTELPFLFPGAPETTHVFGLHIAAGLPDGAEAWLELPTYLADVMGLRSPSVQRDRARGTAHVPLNTQGRTPLGEALLPGNTAVPLRILVRMPTTARDRECDLHASQTYDGEEVGRVTWRLTRRPAGTRQMGSAS